MLDGNPPISKLEHRLFFAATALGLLLLLVPTALAIALPSPEPKIKISHGIYSIFDIWDLMSPVYRGAAFLLCVPLAWKLNPTTLTFSIFPLGLLTYFFDYWFIDSQFRIREAAIVNPDYKFATFDFVLVAGSLFDVLTFFLVNVLVVWQATVMYRLFRSHK
ncbi:MAG: hypothetical protein ABJB34_05845 [Acidobacteriota bacterium]